MKRTRLAVSVRVTRPVSFTLVLAFVALAGVPYFPLSKIWDRDSRTEIAVLASDGSIHILQHGTLNTAPVTAAELPARRSFVLATDVVVVGLSGLGDAAAVAVRISGDTAL